MRLSLSLVSLATSSLLLSLDVPAISAVAVQASTAEEKIVQADTSSAMLRHEGLRLAYNRPYRK